MEVLFFRYNHLLPYVTMVVVDGKEAKEIHLEKNVVTVDMENGNVSVKMNAEDIVKELNSENRLKMEPVKDAVDRISEFNKQVKDGTIKSVSS